MARQPTGQRWPASRVEVWSLNRLRPYERNARVHSDAQVAQIAKSIERFGFTVPILADEDGRIIAGHGREAAARLLKLDKVPVAVARGWSEEQKRAYTLADNKLTEAGEWDQGLLKVELGELRAAGFDLDLTGFDPGEISGILADAAPDGIGDVPDDTYTPQYGVTVICASEAEQAAVYGRLRDEGLNCRVVTT